MFENFGSKIKGITAFRAAMEAEHAATEKITVATNMGKAWREAAGIKTPAHVTDYASKVFGTRWPKTRGENPAPMSPLSVRMSGEYFDEDADVAAVAVLCRAYNATAQAAKRAAKAAGEAPKRKRRATKPEQAKPEQAKPEQAKPGNIAKAAAMIQKESDLNWFRRIIDEAFTKKNPKAFLIFAIETKATETEATETEATETEATETEATETEATEAKQAKPPKRRGRQRKAA